MLSKIGNLTDVKSFVLLDKTVFISRFNNVYKYLDGNSIDILDSDETLQNLKCSEGNIFINTNFGIGYYIKNGSSHCLINPIQHISLPFFLSYERTESGKNTVIKNIEDKNFKNDIFGSSTIFTVSNSRYIRWNYQLKIIEAFEFPSAQPLWQFDLATLGEYASESGEKFKYEVEKFIGSVGNSLLVLLQQKEILVFDIESGIVTQHLKTIDNFLGETIIESATSDMLPYFITKYFLQEDRCVIYALFLDVLYEIRKEGDSFKTNVFGLKSEMERHKINPRQVSRNTFYFENKIYFLEQELGRFGILNVETKKIEYVSEVIEIKGEGVGFDKLKEIQANAEKVYVLDKTNTLHIFQKS